MTMIIVRYLLVVAAIILALGLGLLSQNVLIKEYLRNSRPLDALIDGDDYGLKPDSSLIPEVIIAGTQKGGTDALKFFLENHPQMKSSTRQEAHFFDYRCGVLCDRAVSKHYRKKTIEKARKKYCHLLQVAYYHKQPWSDYNCEDDDEERLTFEKTPRYMFDPYIPEKIKTIVPWSKIIILLRDPIERAYSNFKMNYERSHEKVERHGEVSFETCIDIDIRKLTKVGILDSDTFWEVDDEERQKRWLKYYNIHDKAKLTTERVCNYEIGRGLYFMQLLWWFKEYNTAKDKKKIFITKSESLLPDKETHRIDMKPITEFIGIDEIEVESEEKIHASASNFGPMKDETKQKLMKIFDPFNKKLASLLGDEWEDPWPYNM